MKRENRGQIACKSTLRLSQNLNVVEVVVSPDENRPCRMKRNMNKTVASQLPDDHEEDAQEENECETNCPENRGRRRPGVMKKYTGTATKPVYAELVREAWNELTKVFRPLRFRSSQK